MSKFRREMQEIIDNTVHKVDNKHSLYEGDLLSLFIPIIWKLVKKVEEQDQLINILLDDDYGHS